MIRSVIRSQTGSPTRLPTRWSGWGRLALGLTAMAVIPVTLPVREPPTPPGHLIIAARLQAKLHTLANGLRTEVVLCLLGTVEGDTARVTDFFMPDPKVSTPSSSLSSVCPANTQAVWHNHPMVEATSDEQTTHGFRSLREPVSHPRELCVLSATDIRTSLKLGHPFVVVAVDAHTWCWWSLEQVREFAEQPGSLGYPIPGQLQWRSRGVDQM
jgi:hypothetical protein